MLEDLIAAAFNDANRRVDEAQKKKLGGGMNYLQDLNTI